MTGKWEVRAGGCRAGTRGSGRHRAASLRLSSCPPPPATQPQMEEFCPQKKNKIKINSPQKAPVLGEGLGRELGVGAMPLGSWGHGHGLLPRPSWARLPLGTRLCVYRSSPLAPPAFWGEMSSSGHTSPLHRVTGGSCWPFYLWGLSLGFVRGQDQAPTGSWGTFLAQPMAEGCSIPAPNPSCGAVHRGVLAGRGWRRAQEGDCHHGSCSSRARCCSPGLPHFPSFC